MLNRLLPLLFALLLPLASTTASSAQSAESASPRTYANLNEAGWRFQYGKQGEAVTRPGFDDSKWERISVPHTWNRIGEYALERSAATNNKQGVGWYRLNYTAPAAPKNKRFYLDFAAVGAIADVWVNGQHVGQHKGAFSRFRFDVTAAWKPGAANLIAVKADNSKPAPGSSTEHVLPLAGDFFIHGGMYRGVRLITANDVGIDLLDYGGPGVYVSTLDVTPIALQHRPDEERVEYYSGYRSKMMVRAKIRNASASKAEVRTVVRFLCDQYKDTAAPEPLGWSSKSVTVAPTGTAEIPMVFDYSVVRWANYCRPWAGHEEPSLISARIDLFHGKMLIDSVVQAFGIRTFTVAPNTGATLNGKPIKLKGVSRHQDRLGKGYALTREDHAEDMRLIKEMGANSVRHAHYQHADEWADEADKAGMLVWAELPYVSTPTITEGQGSPELWANAEQQLRELIRQNYNHPSIVMWSIGNEVDVGKVFGASKGNPSALPLLQHLQKIAKQEDPTRPTVFADCCEDLSTFRTAGEKLAGTADLIGYNRYFGWYYPKPLDAAAQLGAELDKFHAKHPTLPISVSEYGAGGAISQFSDNPLGGFINFAGRPQPEAYESWLHEQSWPAIRDRPFVFGSWVWNMFDFASDLRNEGDAVDINTKGLVTMDRKTKKDAFYYYKAQWNPEPMIWLTDKRYVNRSYGTMDVKAYTTESKAFLQVNGAPVVEAPCPDHVCVWRNVALNPGPNRITAMAGYSDRGMPVQMEDQAVWIGPDPAKGIRINAGTNAVTQIGGKQFGSDTFVTGGKAMLLNQTGILARGAPKRSVQGVYPALFDYWREGEAFSYRIPVPDGKWTVTVHSFDPNAATVPGQTMSISANGKIVVPPFSPASVAGGTLKAMTKRFPVTVEGGVLTLDFAGQGGKAVVAAIEIAR